MVDSHESSTQGVSGGGPKKIVHIVYSWYVSNTNMLGKLTPKLWTLTINTVSVRADWSCTATETCNRTWDDIWVYLPAVFIDLINLWLFLKDSMDAEPIYVEDQIRNKLLSDFFVFMLQLIILMLNEIFRDLETWHYVIILHLKDFALITLQIHQCNYTDIWHLWHVMIW